MNEQNAAFDWGRALADTYAEFSRQLLAHTPQLLGAVLLLLAGWLIAWLLQIGVRKLVTGLEAAFRRIMRVDTARRAPLHRPHAAIVGRAAFRPALVFVIAAAAKMRGWHLFAGRLDSLVVYLPNLVTGLFIILAGVVVGAAARTAVNRTAASAGIQRADALARGAQIVVVFTAAVVGVEQIGINIDFLSTVIVVAAGVLLAGGALAFALGARTFVANMIGVQFARRYFRVGETIRVGDVEGQLLEIAQTALLLDTPEGRTAIPGKMLHEQVSVLRPEGSADDTGS
jgi:hypothetical protein